MNKKELKRFLKRKNREKIVLKNKHLNFYIWTSRKYKKTSKMWKITQERKHPFPIFSLF